MEIYFEHKLCIIGNKIESKQVVSEEQLSKISKEAPWSKIRISSLNAEIWKDEYWYIEPDGLLTKSRFNGARSSYLVSNGKRLFLMNNNRKEIVSLDHYTEVQECSQGLVAVKKNNLWGLLNETGLEIAPCKYVEIEDVGDLIFAILLNKNSEPHNVKAIYFDESFISSLPIPLILEFHRNLHLIKAATINDHREVILNQLEMKEILEKSLIREKRNYEISDAVEFFMLLDSIRNTSSYRLVILDYNGDVLDEDESIHPDSISQAENIFKVPVHQNGEIKYILIDSEFNQITPFLYDDVSTSDTEFLIAEIQGQFGLIYCTGQILLNFVYDRVVPFDEYENLFIIQKDEELHMVDVLDQTAERKPYFGLAPTFKLNGFHYSVDPENLYVYDQFGELIYKFMNVKMIQAVTDFVLKCEDCSGYSRLIVNNIKIDNLFGRVCDVGEGKVFAENVTLDFNGVIVEKKSLLIDSSGQFTVLEGNVQVDTFSEGLGVAISVEHKYGFVDSNGKVTIPFEYEAALPFSEGKAAIKKNGSWGFINKLEEFEFPPLFDYVVRGFFNHFAWVVYLGVLYRLDETGNLYIGSDMV